MIYWICFLLSALLINEGEHKKGNYGKLLTLLGLLCPVLLAALRSIDVGTDVHTYLIPIFNIAGSSNDYLDFLVQITTTTAMDIREIGYCSIIYFSSKIANNINIVFLFIELLMIVPLFYSIIVFSKLKETSFIHFSKATSVLVYLAMFYNLFLSATRLGIACSFAVLSVVMWMEKRMIKSILFGIIGASFHHSGIFVFAIILLYILCIKKHKKIVRFIIIAGIVFACFYDRIFPFVMEILQKFGVISQKFSGWQSGTFYTTAEGGVNIAVLVYSLFALLITLLLYKKYKNSVTRFLFLTSFLMICLTPFVGTYANFGRINTYFKIFSIFILPMSVKINLFRFGPSVSTSKIALICNYVFLLVFWIITYQITDFTSTSRYIFFWQ